LIKAYSADASGAMISVMKHPVMVVTEYLVIEYFVTFCNTEGKNSKKPRPSHGKTAII